jgi:hypothetical protein
MGCLKVRSKDIVGTLPAYRDLVVFAQDALRALSATGLLSTYKANYLYSIMCQDRCFGCANFDSVLFLPTGQQCCFSCIGTHPKIAVLSVSAAAALFGLADKSSEANYFCDNCVRGIWNLSEASPQTDPNC